MCWQCLLSENSSGLMVCGMDLSRLPPHERRAHHHHPQEDGRRCQAVQRYCRHVCRTASLVSMPSSHLWPGQDQLAGQLKPTDEPSSPERTQPSAPIALSIHSPRPISTSVCPRLLSQPNAAATLLALPLPRSQFPPSSIAAPSWGPPTITGRTTPDRGTSSPSQPFVSSSPPSPWDSGCWPAITFACRYGGTITLPSLPW